MQDRCAAENTRELPDWFGPVAEDVLRVFRPEEGLWVDLGSGSGGLGLALAKRSHGTILLVDPNADELGKGLEKARRCGLQRRVAAVVGNAESIPLPDCSVNLVVSRGSIFFWDDPGTALREVHRILRPRAKAMIGGGLGSSYPEWARKEFMRWRLEGVKRRGPEALRQYEHVRKPETFRRWAQEAGLTVFEVTTESPGIWLTFQKELD